MLDGFIEVTPILGVGVYALLRDGVVVYVGQSKKMLQRISAHKLRRRHIERLWLDNIRILDPRKPLVVRPDLPTPLTQPARRQRSSNADMG